MKKLMRVGKDGIHYYSMYSDASVKIGGLVLLALSEQTGMVFSTI